METLLYLLVILRAIILEIFKAIIRKPVDLFNKIVEFIDNLVSIILNFLYKHLKKIIIGLGVYSLWSPVIYLSFKLLDWENHVILGLKWLTPKAIFSLFYFLVILVIISMMLSFCEIKLMSENRKSIEIPDSEGNCLDRYCVRLARKNPNYKGSVDFMLDNDYKSLTQKLFSSIMAVTTILYTTIPQEKLCQEYKELFQIYVFITSGIYLFIFSFLFFESRKIENNQKRNIREYLLMFYCILGNLLASIFFLILFYFISNYDKVSISSDIFLMTYLCSIIICILIFLFAFLLVTCRVQKLKQKYKKVAQ